MVNRSELVMKPLDSSTHSELSERFSCCASRTLVLEFRPLPRELPDGAPHRVGDRFLADIAVSARETASLVDKVARLDVVHVSWLEVVGAIFWEHFEFMLLGKQALDAEGAYRSILRKLDRQRFKIAGDFGAARIPLPDRRIVNRLSGHDRAFHETERDDAVEVADFRRFCWDAGTISPEG